ncbi:MAG: ABC transporter permease [Myxococcales bacterium]
MDSVLQDLRYALRKLFRAPGFTVVAVLTLALAIGASTAVFSIVDGVLLKSLPFRDPDRLVRVESISEDKVSNASQPDFLDYRTQSRTVSPMAAYSVRSANLTAAGSEPVRIQLARVSAVWFDLLGVAPRMGRGFHAEEENAGAAPVAVLSQAIWRSRFGGDPAILGKTISIGGKSVTVVGVAPAQLRYPDDADAWVPLVFEGWEAEPGNRGGHWLRLVGRLAPRATVAEARQELRKIADGLARQYPESNSRYSANATPLLDATVGAVRPALWALLGAVVFVLLIACANVANLMLVRAGAREGEIAVRRALGAGSWRLARQLVVESVLVSLIAALAGALLAGWAVDAVAALGPRGIPRLDSVAVDGRALAFAIGVASVTGIVFGLVPALHATRPDVAQVLRRSSPAAVNGGSGGSGRTRGILIVGEMALAVVLLAGAGLLGRSFLRLVDTDPGLRTEGVTTFSVNLPEAKYPNFRQQWQFADRLIERLRRLPGAQDVGVTYMEPFTSTGFRFSYEVAGRPPKGPGNKPSVETRPATPGFFRAAGLRLLRGRFYDENDSWGRPRVVVVSEEFVRRTFPGEDPIGKHIELGWDGTDDEGAHFRGGGEIVGVVADVRQFGPKAEAPPLLYIPFSQAPVESLTALVRSSADPAAVHRAAREAMRELDPDLPLFRLSTMAESRARSIDEPRFYATLLGGFALLALFLAVVGIYGVISYSVSQRTRELGIRLALGATARKVLTLVLRQGLALVAAGIVLGLAASFALTRVLASLLYGVGTLDPLTLASVCVLLAAAAVVACWLPARRAARVDPIIAMKAE